MQPPAMAYREHEKELKQHDEFQKLGDQAVPWLEKHGKGVISSVGVVLLLWGGFAIASHFNAKGDEAAAYDFGAAVKLLGRPVNATPPAVLPEGEEAPFKTEQEKDEAIIQRLADFRLKYSGRRSTTTAALPLAEAYLRQNKPDLALTLVQEFLKDSDAADPMRAPAFEVKGYAYEQMQKWDDALAAFDQLAKENRTDFLKGMGLYHRARVLFQKGDTQGAMQQFADLQTVAPDSAAARMAKERLTLLAAQGLAIPKAAVPAAAIDAGK